MRILIAEDDEAARMILEAAVRQLGHESVSANDGAEAWRLFQLGKVDAIISDRAMPVMDGFELCRRIRALPGSGYSYFIFLTSFSDKTGIRDGMSVGADDYLGKTARFRRIVRQTHRGDAPDGTASTTRSSANGTGATQSRTICSGAHRSAHPAREPPQARRGPRDDCRQGRAV